MCHSVRSQKLSRLCQLLISSLKNETLIVARFLILFQPLRHARGDGAPRLGKAEPEVSTNGRFSDSSFLRDHIHRVPLGDQFSVRLLGACVGKRFDLLGGKRLRR